MSRIISCFSIFCFLNLFSLFLFAAEKKLCLGRFDPTQNNFSFEIETEAECKTGAKEIELKKEKFGIWVLVPLKEANPESRNEEKYGRSDSSKQ